MPSAARLARDRAHVDLVDRRAQRDLPRRAAVAGRLADERRDERALDRAEHVDDPLGVRLGRADRLEVVAQEVRDDDLAALEHLRALERAREQLQLRELDVLVHALEDAVHVGARLDEIGREPERLRRRVRVLEAARVGDERDVERLGDLRRQRDAELAEHVREHLARRGRVRDDEVDVAEARVVVVVVDVDRERRGVDDARLGADPARARAVDGDEHALAEVGRPLAPKPALLELEEPVLAGKRRRAAEEHDDVLAELAQREAHRRAASRARRRRVPRAR